MLRDLQHLVHDEGGATMVEYGIMVSLIAAVSILLVGTLGQNVCKAFNSVNQSL